MDREQVIHDLAIVYAQTKLEERSRDNGDASNVDRLELLYSFYKDSVAILQKVVE